MQARYTRHAQKRAQQRGIPHLVGELLLAYGRRAYDGRGAVKRYFDKHGRKVVRAVLGDEGFRRIAKHLACYMVQDCRSGVVITVGIRHKHARIFRH